MSSVKPLGWATQLVPDPRTRIFERAFHIDEASSLTTENGLGRLPCAATKDRWGFGGLKAGGSCRRWVRDGVFVRYIVLNPVRAKLVERAQELEVEQLPRHGRSGEAAGVARSGLGPIALCARSVGARRRGQEGGGLSVAQADPARRSRGRSRLRCEGGTSEPHRRLSGKRSLLSPRPPDCPASAPTG
jgi:hypothetical protein